MASSSSSSSSSLVAQQHHQQISYDVFVSFRGLDVRSGFLSHLTKAFDGKGIDVYVDERLDKGEELSLMLLKAIEASQISLIIFSPNYASSTWCLDELTKIIESKEKYSQTVIPIFYQTEPSDVRHQIGNYGIPFAEHEQRYDEKMVQKWRAASKKAANLSGFSLSNIKGTEAEFIQEIVKCVVKILYNERIQKYYKKLVGIHRRIATIELSLYKRSKEVCIVGLWGPGGIGKSTIARALFSKLLSEYRGCCSVIYLQEELEKNQIADIKMKLYSQLLRKKFNETPMILGLPNYVTRRLERTKVLILLDDVYELEHLKILLHEGKNLFGPSSIIIVTSRDKQVLHSVAGDCIYEVEALTDDEALQLFSLNAFEQENPEKEWIGLSKRLVAYAYGNPLALRVLGSSLFKVDDPREWESLLERLEKMPCKDIQNVLKSSYDQLERDHQKIFLFLSCFFEYSRKDRIETLLDACGFSTLFGLRNLENKAFIKILNEGNVHLHNLSKEMGRNIVCEEDEPGKRRHLWDPNDIREVLERNTGTEAIQSIKLDISEMDLNLKPQIFKKMVNLKLLEFWTLGKCDGLHCSEGLESLPNQLRLLHWDGYPLKSLPLMFCTKNLVELYMENSKLEKLWDGVQDLVNLKKIDLSKSEHLIRLPDLSKASKLKEIILPFCYSLVEVHESIFSLHQLEELDLVHCKKLKSLKSEVHLKSLRWLRLDGCVSLEDFSVISKQMKYLGLGDTAIIELSPSIKFLKKLEGLMLYGCKNLRYLPNELSELRSLRRLDLHDCLNLDPSTLHIILSCSEYLVYLDLNKCYKLGELPKNVPLSFKHFSRITYLHLSNCLELQHVSDLPPFIKELSVSNCKRLQSIIGLPIFIEVLWAENCESLKIVTNCTSMLTFPNWSARSFSCSSLSFVNCIGLDEHAVSCIMEFVHCKIKLFSYYICGGNGFDDRENVQVFLPRWKVPDWLKHRATGGLIKIPLDISANSMCMGLICCIIISDFQSDEEYLGSPGCRTTWVYRCRVEVTDGQRVLNYKYDCEFPSRDMRMHFRLLSLDHMLLVYHHKSFYDVLEMRDNDHNGQHEKRVSLQFEAIDRSGTSLVIKECGVHPIYASEYFDSDELLHLKKHNWKFETTSIELKSESNSTFEPTKKTLVPLVTESWKNKASGLQQVLEFGKEHQEMRTNLIFQASFIMGWACKDSSKSQILE